MWDFLLDKVVNTPEVEKYFDSWLFYQENQDHVSLGMLPLFLCAKHEKMKKLWGKDRFYGVLDDIARDVSIHEPESLVITPNHANPSFSPMNPLCQAVLNGDTKAIVVLLKHTSLEGIHLQRQFCESRRMVKAYLLLSAIKSGVEYVGIELLIQCIEKDEILAEAENYLKGGAKISSALKLTPLEQKLILKSIRLKRQALQPKSESSCCLIL